MRNNILLDLKQVVVNSEGEEIPALTEKTIHAGYEPLEIINMALMPGIKIVGDRYESGEYFLPHLIIAAEGIKKAMALLDPELQKRGQKAEKLGTVVIGTVRGDIHEIGKSLVASLLSANGFEVHDLGVDVPVEKFIQKVKETRADAVGLSALLTTTMLVQKDVIEALEVEGFRARVKVIIGGAPVTREWASKIGADGYADSAMSAVGVLKKLIKD